MSFRVSIVSKAGTPVSDLTVVLRFKSFARVITAAEMTNGDGNADFDGHEDGSIQVFVDGSDRGEHQYLDGKSITLPQ